VRRRNIHPREIERVVVRGVNWVGDAVMTVPALRELRRVLPHAHITLATRPWAEGLFADADFLDDILIYERGRRDFRAVTRQIRAWRGRRFDLALLFQNAFEAALIARASRVPLRMGYGTDGRRALLSHAIQIPPWRSNRHEVFYYLNLVAELERLLYGSSQIMEREPKFTLDVSEKRRALAREFLLERGVATDSRLIALCPGSTNSRAKRWPAERYAALADRFVENTGATVLLIGSADELDVSREVEQLMRQPPFMLTGGTDLATAVAILSLAEILITNDTGPAHISAALNRPTLVIFGPTDPRTTRPFSPLAQIIRRPPECAPCMLRDCPIDHRCMTSISPEEVFSQASLMMKGKMTEVHT
jgi:heptosyltransferase-2